MPTLPTRADLGQFQVRATTPGINVPDSPIGAALQGLGGAVAKVGATLQAADRQADEFEAQRKLIEFQDQQSQALDEGMRNAEPGAPNFGETARTDFRKAGDEFYQGLPEPLKPKFAPKLKAMEAQVAGKARAFEYKATDAAVSGLVDDSANRLLNRVGTATSADEVYAAHQAAQTDADDLLSSAPLTPIQREVAGRNVRTQLLTAAAERLAQVDPQAALGALGGGRAAGGSAVPGSYLSAIKQTEGFEPAAKWDYKQFTNGYGTKARAHDERIDRSEAERRFADEIGKAAAFVDSVNPNLDPGTRAALTSLTFNAGTKWADSGLGEKVRAGDLEGAKQSFLQYNKAGGETNAGLAARRAREAAWFGQGGAEAGGVPGDPRFAELPLPVRQKALNIAQQNIKAIGTDEERAQRLEKQYVQRVSDQTENTMLKQLYSDTPDLTVKDIVNDDRLTREAKERMIGVANRANKPEPLTQVSQRTSIALLERMRRPDGDPEKVIDDKPIYDAYFRGDLNKADFHDLRKELLDAKTPAGQALSADRTEFFKRYAASIDGAMDLGGHSALGSQKLYEAERDVRRQEELLKKKGLDPHLIYDPTSEHFFGKPANIAKYRVSMQDAMKYGADLAKADKDRAEAKPTVTPAGPAKQPLASEVIDVPAGMSPAEVIQWAKETKQKPGTRIRLPDGRIGTLPQ